MQLLRLTGAALAGYALGTAPSADVVTRLATDGATDIRDHGTGNPGAANVKAVLGARWGAVVMVADIAKGAAAGRLGRRLAGDGGAHVAATAAVVGHCYPVVNGFRGGKGVATRVGQLAATFPAYFPIDFAVGAAAHSLPVWRNRAHAATAVASATWVAAAVLWWRRRWPNLWGPTPSPAAPLAAVASSAVLLGRFAAEGRRPGIGDGVGEGRRVAQSKAARRASTRVSSSHVR